MYLCTCVPVCLCACVPGDEDSYIETYILVLPIAAAVVEFFRSMLAASVTCYCFPVLLLVHHHNSLSLVDPDAYKSQERGC